MKFTKKTNQNIEYIKNHYKIDKRKLTIHRVLRFIFNSLRPLKIKNYNYIRASKVSVIETSGSYFPQPIVDKINQTQYEEYTFKLRKQNYRFVIKLYSEKAIPIKSYIHYIKLILVLFISYKPLKTISYNTITIYLTDFEKKIDVPLTPYNVNSGYKYKNEIKIYRKEEWFKVFIHECIHLFEFDLKGDFSLMKKYFPIQSSFLLFELYTEYWARIINISIWSMNKSFPVFKRTFHKYFKMEQLYSALSAKKILKAYNLDYRQLLQPNHYAEETNVFCYYILTSLLFYYDTMSFLVDKRMFDFKDTHTFIKYIIHLHKKDEWLNYLDTLEHYETPNINMALYEKVF